MSAACAESRLVSVDEGDSGPDAATAPELDAGVDVPDLPPRVYPPLYDPSFGADETSLPLCEFPDTLVIGHEGRVCSNMDSPCGRGIREPEGCCRFEPRHRGTACGDGLMCDDNGSCVPRTGEPPRDVNGVIGRDPWIDARPLWEFATMWPMEPRGARLNFGSHRAVELIPTADEVIGLEQIHIVNGRYYGVEAFAIVAPTVRRGFYFPDTTTEACVVLGSVDAMHDVRGDCTSPGALRVACPSAGPIGCEVLEGWYARVTGDDIGLAWVPAGALADVPDVRAALVGPAYLGLPTYRSTATPRAAPTALVLTGDPIPPPPPIQCSPSQCGDGQLCTDCHGKVTPGLCNPFTGCLLVCPLDPEVCDGIDNDCDGSVDEDASMLCDDGVSCTIDACMKIGGTTGCFPVPDWTTCAIFGAACARPRCNGVGLGSSLPPVPGDTLTPTSPVTGCSLLVRNTWCTNTWNDCACDGAELCSSGPTADGSGCVPALPTTGTGASFVTGIPCETDKMYCTSGVPTCCEPEANRTTCLNLKGLSTTARADYDRVCYSTVGRLFQSSPKVSSTGETVTCMLNRPRGHIIEWPIYQDTNACTKDKCVEPTAFPWIPVITNTQKPAGTQVARDPVIGIPRLATGSTCGTTETINEGCGVVQCSGGTVSSYGGVIGCELASKYVSPEADLSACRRSPCVRTADGFCIGGTCMSRGCNNLPTCNNIPHNDRCQDTLACTTGTCTGDFSSRGGGRNLRGRSVTTNDAVCPEPPADDPAAPAACYDAQCAVSHPPGSFFSGLRGCYWVRDPAAPDWCSGFI